MPRREINNPTSRILRLLDDIDQLEAAYDEAIAVILEIAPQLMETRCSVKPALTSVTEERTRQHLMGRRTEANRASMQRTRLRSEVEPRVSGLTQAQEAAIRKEVEAASAPSAADRLGDFLGLTVAKPDKGA